MENKGNKELQDILKKIFEAKAETGEAADNGILDIDKFTSIMKGVTSKIEKGMSGYSQEVQDLLNPILKDAKKKGTKEYIYKQAEKK